MIIVIYLILFINLINAYSLTKVGIITGGTRGLGYGIAISLAEKKYDLLLTYNSNTKNAIITKNLIEKTYNNRVELICGDLSCKETRKIIYKNFDNKFNNNTHELGVIVHNAGQYIGLTSNNIKKIKYNKLIFGDGSLLNDNEDFQTDEIQYYQELY